MRPAGRLAEAYAEAEERKETVLFLGLFLGLGLSKEKPPFLSFPGYRLEPASRHRACWPGSGASRGQESPAFFLNFHRRIAGLVGRFSAYRFGKAGETGPVRAKDLAGHRARQEESFKLSFCLKAFFKPRPESIKRKGSGLSDPRARSRPGAGREPGDSRQKEERRKSGSGESFGPAREEREAVLLDPERGKAFARLGWPLSCSTPGALKKKEIKISFRKGIKFLFGLRPIA